MWDVANLDVITTVPLEDTNDLTCMSLQEDHDVVAVGSQYWITLIDRRSGVVINQIRSVDQEWGVRSLNFLGQKTISIGGGMGRLAFYDMCADKYRPIDKHSQQPYLTLGDGWIAKDEMYRNYLAQNHNQPVPNAVYTHCYDPTFTRLFVGGGPLLLGLKGAYAAFW